MGFLLLLLTVLIFFMSSPCVELISASDRLQRGDSLSTNQTLVSASGIFALGFFSLAGSSSKKFYLGIWFDNLPGRTVVWVANRQKPLLDPSGVITITSEGYFAVIDSNASIIWSIEASPVSSNVTAVIQDDGNIVLRGGDDGRLIWQSFDNPTDTLLPGMKLRVNPKPNLSSVLRSWANKEDPSPGNFAFGIDPATSLQLMIWEGSKIKARSQVWSGNPIGVTRDPKSLSIFFLSMEIKGEEAHVKFSSEDGSTPGRVVLDFTGTLKWMLWDNSLRNWSERLISEPRGKCDVYGACGPSSICNASFPSLTCSCFQGFEPRNKNQWNKGNFTEGCSRISPLNCNAGDQFLKMDGLKIPNGFYAVKNASSIELCEGECFRRCNCSAYFYSSLNVSGAVSQCLIWVREMVDISQPYLLGQSVYLRLAAVNSASGNRKSSRRIIFFVMLPLSASAAIFFGLFLFVKKMGRKERKESKGWSGFEALECENGSMELRFLDFDIVMASTDNFSDENKLGEGGFGAVYKGRLPQGEEIAVKRLSERSNQGESEFHNEVKLIARLQHRNLVRLVACCSQTNEKILIYEYLQNKSLDKYIFDREKSKELDWGKRERIIEGIAQGLLYLHRYSRLRIIHRDLKTSNVLLDDEMNPKISDFGLARIFGGNQTEASTDKIVGTIGYMSPEYALSGLFSEKSDVFSFGVMVLEIISGKRSSGFYHTEKALSFLGVAWRLWQQGRGVELVDSSIRETVLEAKALRFINIGLLCTQENPAHRPSMSSIVSMLSNEDADLPSPNHSSFSQDTGPKYPIGSFLPCQTVYEVTDSDVCGR